ncbi:unnamed protein product [Mytilus coruscus]|uniref:Uncharacterized protein n=1 Tax=Mytilus coruscus TaxID=42192 RepID=A0A6J8EW45_MYTCO|nr:unnamed protein product [Mytilus coruscus]
MGACAMDTSSKSYQEALNVPRNNNVRLRPSVRKLGPGASKVAVISLESDVHPKKVLFGCPHKVGIATSPKPTEMLATLQQEKDLNFEITNRHYGSFLTSVNQNGAISVVNSSLPDILPASETPDSQPTSEISDRQPTSETQDSQQTSDVEASLLDILIPQAQSDSVEDHTPYELHNLQYERECNKCSEYFQTDSALQVCCDICIRLECIQRERHERGSNLSKQA